MAPTRGKLNVIDDGSVLDAVRNAVNQVITSDEFVDKIVSLLLGKMKNELQTMFKDAVGRIEVLESENTCLKQEINTLRVSVDDMEQYSRRQNLRIYGIPEKTDENTDQIVVNMCKKQLGIDIDVSQVCSSHRIGKTSEGKHRALIVKFTNHNTKSAVYNNKKLLKSTNIVIKEDLTYNKLQLLKLVSRKTDRKNVWTRDGVIFLRVNDQIRKICHESDLAGLNS